MSATEQRIDTGDLVRVSPSGDVGIVLPPPDHWDRVMCERSRAVDYLTGPKQDGGWAMVPMHRLTYLGTLVAQSPVPTEQVLPHPTEVRVNDLVTVAPSGDVAVVVPPRTSSTLATGEVPWVRFLTGSRVFLTVSPVELARLSILGVRPATGDTAPMPGTPIVGHCPTCGPKGIGEWVAGSALAGPDGALVMSQGLAHAIDAWAPIGSEPHRPATWGTAMDSPVTFVGTEDVDSKNAVREELRQTQEAERASLTAQHDIEQEYLDSVEYLREKRAQEKRDERNARDEQAPDQRNAHDEQERARSITRFLADTGRRVVDEVLANGWLPPGGAADTNTSVDHGNGVYTLMVTVGIGSDGAPS